MEVIWVEFVKRSCTLPVTISRLVYWSCGLSSTNFKYISLCWLQDHLKGVISPRLAFVVGCWEAEPYVFSNSGQALPAWPRNVDGEGLKLPAFSPDGGSRNDEMHSHKLSSALPMVFCGRTVFSVLAHMHMMVRRMALGSHWLTDLVIQIILGIKYIWFGLDERLALKNHSNLEMHARKT